jgi:hypothetical protein
MVLASKQELLQAFRDNLHVVVGAAAAVLSSIDERKLSIEQCLGG